MTLIPPLYSGICEKCGSKDFRILAGPFRDERGDRPPYLTIFVCPKGHQKNVWSQAEGDGA